MAILAGVSLESSEGNHACVGMGPLKKDGYTGSLQGDNHVHSISVGD